MFLINLSFLLNRAFNGHRRLANSEMSLQSMSE